MTETSKSHPRGPRRRSLLLTLLLATAALAGAQALVPGLASATIQMGEECADPTYPSADCEPNGGGGGSQGGGTSDGSIAGEVIEVHDTPPSPCVVNPSSCLPRQTGGGPRGVQADRGPYLPRHGGRPARVAKVPKGRTPITREECEGLKKRLDELSADDDYSWAQIQTDRDYISREKEIVEDLEEQLRALAGRKPQNASIWLGQVQQIRSQLRAHREEVEALVRQAQRLTREWLSVRRGLDQLRPQRHAFTECKVRYGIEVRTDNL